MPQSIGRFVRQCVKVLSNPSERDQIVDSLAGRSKRSWLVPLFLLLLILAALFILAGTEQVPFIYTHF